LNGECFVDSAPPNRLLPDHNDYPDNTPRKCIFECRKRGFAYAGVQYGINCFCGNTRPPDVWSVDSSQCHWPCEGDQAQKCGGLNWQMNVYQIGELNFTMF